MIGYKCLCRLILYSRIENYKYSCLVYYNVNTSKKTTVCISNETWCRINKLRASSEVSFEDIIKEGLLLQEKEDKLVVIN